MTLKAARYCLPTLLMLFIGLTVVHHTYAQKFAVGIKAGGTISKSDFGDNDDNDDYTNSTKLGFFGAGLVNFPLKDRFSFQTEFGYAKRGRKIEFNEGTWDNNATYRYLDGVALLRKSYPLKWSQNVKGTWFFNIGPRVSYWLSGKGTITAGGFFVDENGTTQISKGGSYDYKVKFSASPDVVDAPDINTMYLSDVNRWLFGLDFGIGFEVRFTSGHTFYGDKNSAFNRTLGFNDNLRANEKILSISVDYTLNKEVREGKKGKSTKKDVKTSKPRKSIDSLLH
jgi:Outer membrane protein beta-barrel domain